MSAFDKQEGARVAAYCRVSTDKEDQRNSVKTQQAFFSAYIEEHAGWVSAGVFADEGLTGTSMSRRPAFTRMLALAKAGGVDLILTKEVSRFARNTVDTLTVTRELKTLGVGVLFLNDGIDTRDPDGEFRLTIMASVAQEESRKISERTRWGQDQARKRGVVFGNDSVFGYHLRGGQLTVDPLQAQVVREIYRKFLTEGKGAYTIARELTEAGVDPPMGPGGTWSSAAVLRLLRNEKYTGDLLQRKYYTLDYLSYRKVRNEGYAPQLLLRDHHEAIVPRELFRQVQTELARRREMQGDKRRFSARYWYSGKVVCGACGSSFTPKRTRRSGREYVRLICRGSSSDRHGGRCGMRGMSLKMLETCARHVLAQLPLDRKAMAETLRNALLDLERSGDRAAQEREILRQAIRRQTARRDRALEAYLDGTVSREEWTRQARQCDGELARLRRELDRREALPPSGEESEDRADAIGAMVYEALDGSPAVLEEVIRQIVVFQDRFEVSVQELPVRFRVQAEGRGSGPGYRVEVTACVAIPVTETETDSGRSPG